MPGLGLQDQFGPALASQATASQTIPLPGVLQIPPSVTHLILLPLLQGGRAAEDGWKKKRMLARACHLLQRENYITIQCAPLSPPSSLALDKMHVLSSSSPVVLSLTTPGTLLGIRTCKIVWLEESWERNSLIFPERRYTKERNRSSAFVTLSGYNSVSEDQISGFLLPRLYGSLF